MTTLPSQYVAGIIDGEGCIQLSNMGPNSIGVSLTVVNTNKTVIQRLYRQYKGYFQTGHPHGNRKSYWRWIVRSSKAVKVLKECLPYFIIKRNQAKLALRYWKYKRTHLGVVRADKGFKLQMQQLNKRGIR